MIDAAAGIALATMQAAVSAEFRAAGFCGPEQAAPEDDGTLIATGTHMQTGFRETSAVTLGQPCSEVPGWRHTRIRHGARP